MADLNNPETALAGGNQVDTPVEPHIKRCAYCSEYGHSAGEHDEVMKRRER